MDESSSTHPKSNAAPTNKFELTGITDIDYKHDTKNIAIDKTESSRI